MAFASVKYIFLLHGACALYTENMLSYKATPRQPQATSLRALATPRPPQASPRPALATTRPHLHRVAWVHIPKCGQSFGNTLLHYANASLSADVFMTESNERHQCIKFASRLRLEQQLNFNTLFWGGESWSDHRGINGSDLTAWQDKFMGMFRPPSSRLLSAYRFFWNGTGSVEKFFMEHRGLVSEMLSGVKNEGANPINTGHGDVELAKSRLRSFAFVGLTLEWDFSICLFHAMFGGPCQEFEFMNMHRTKLNTDVNPFDWFYDTEDENLFREVNQTFWANMRMHNVTRQTCQLQFCRNHPFPFQLPLDLQGSSALLQVEKYDYDWPGRLQVDDNFL